MKAIKSSHKKSVYTFNFGFIEPKINIDLFKWIDDNATPAKSKNIRSKIDAYQKLQLVRSDIIDDPANTTKTCSSQNRSISQVRCFKSQNGKSPSRNSGIVFSGMKVLLNQKLIGRSRIIKTPKKFGQILKEFPAEKNILKKKIEV